MAFPLSCNVCLRSNTQLLNVCEDVRQRKLYQLAQLLASPQRRIDVKDFPVCAACHLILKKIFEFQLQLLRTQKNIELLLAKHKSSIGSTENAANILHNNRQSVEKIEIQIIDENMEMTELVSTEEDEPDEKEVKREYANSDAEDEAADYNDEGTSQIENSGYDSDDEPLRQKPRVMDSNVDESVLATTSNQTFARNEVLAVIEDIKTRYLNNQKCCLCDFISTNRESLISHVKSDHEEDFTEWCNLCNCLHYSDEERNCLDSFICKFCEQANSDPNHLVCHLYTHCESSKPAGSTPSSKRYYVCRRCKAVCQDEVAMRAHKCTRIIEPLIPASTSRPKPLRKYTCWYCGRDFPK